MAETAHTKSAEIPTSLARKQEPETEEKWASRLIARLATPDDFPDRIVVSAGATKSKMAKVCQIKISADTTAASLVADIDAAIVSSGYTLGKVECFRPNERTPEIVRVWQIPAAEAEPDEIDEGERNSPAAATAGLLRQAYAHNETLMRSMQGLFGETLAHFRDVTAGLKDELKSLRGENTTLTRALSTREDERLERETVRNRETAIASSFQALVSAVAVRLSGGGTAPSEFAKLLESLSGEQQDAIFSTLNDGQKALLVSMLQTVEEQKKEVAK